MSAVDSDTAGFTSRLGKDRRSRHPGNRFNNLTIMELPGVVKKDCTQSRPRGTGLQAIRFAISARTGPAFSRISK